MKYIAISIMYAAFFSLIGCAVFFTSSGWPLLALVFTPSWADSKAALRNNDG